MRQRLARDGINLDYQVLRSNWRWPDHQLRTLVTAAAIAWLKPESILDPACGDGSIVLAAENMRAMLRIALNDISEPNRDHVRREIDRRFPHSPEHPAVWCVMASGIYAALAASYEEVLEVDRFDLVVLTEILEHLEDPDEVLALARQRGKWLIASSPEMRPEQIDTNPEHLWMFDRTGYRGMLVRAGWTVQQYTFLNFPTEYDFGIWVCS